MTDTKPQVFVAIGVFSLLLLCLCLQPLLTQPAPWPTANPIPRLETGLHTAAVWRLSVDAQERFLVTASKDKTARVWDLAGGKLKLLQVLRVPMGNDPFEGQLYTAAISPNGADIAVGGYTGSKDERSFAIYIFDRESGGIKKAIGGLPAEISYLTFFRDGNYLAATLVGKQGLRVYSSHDWSEVYRDQESYTYDSYWADFGPDNRLVTTSYDGNLRLYKPHEGKFQRLLIAPAKKGSKPATARFSPDGSLLAVGFLDSPQVKVFSGETLKLLYEPDIRGIQRGHLARLAWSQDGTRLYAGGGFSDQGIHPILGWTDNPAIGLWWAWYCRPSL